MEDDTLAAPWGVRCDRSQLAQGSSNSRGHTGPAAVEERQARLARGRSWTDSTGLEDSRWWGCPHRSGGQSRGSHSNIADHDHPQAQHGQQSHQHCNVWEPR